MDLVGAVASPDRNSWTGSPSAIHWARPPSRGCTRMMPRRLSWSATRALVAWFGHEQ